MQFQCLPERSKKLKNGATRPSESYALDRSRKLKDKNILQVFEKKFSELYSE